MQSFDKLSAAFAARFDHRHFPDHPSTLYAPAHYFLSLGGKRIRPVLCLMGNELFAPIEEDAWEVATAIELFHNFTLIHDDIMQIGRHSGAASRRCTTNMALPPLSLPVMS